MQAYLEAAVKAQMPVEFHGKFADVVGDWQETYIEPGMRGEIRAIDKMDNGNYRVTVDLSRYRNFNIAFESNDWNHHKDGKHITTNAREAGFYKDVQWFEWNPNRAEFHEFCRPAPKPSIDDYVEG